jgi:hypothetical protein
MNTIVLAGAAFLLVTAPAAAQSPIATFPEITDPAPALMISPEQRARIAQYVIQQKVKPIEAHGRIAIGERLTPELELMAFPSDWGPALTQYRFAYLRRGIALVEPWSRRVVQIIN